MVTIRQGVWRPIEARYWRNGRRQFDDRSTTRNRRALAAIAEASGGCIEVARHLSSASLSGSKTFTWRLPWSSASTRGETVSAQATTLR
jgi:hypothetical protein